MKSFLISLFSFLFLLSLSFFLWDMMPDWAKLVASLAGFFLIVSILGKVFRFLSFHFSKLFIFFLAGACTLLMGIWGYNHFFSASLVQMTNETTDPLTKAIIAISSEETSTLSPNSHLNPILAETPTALTLQNDANTQKESTLEQIESNTQMESEEKTYWKSFILSILDVQLKEMQAVLTNSNTNDQSSIQVLNANSPSPIETPAALQGAIPSATSVKADNFNKNWKQPVVVEATNTPSPATPSKTPKSPRLVSTGVSAEQYVIPLNTINAQMVFPHEYQISSIVRGGNALGDESVSFSVSTPNSLRGFVTVQLSHSGNRVDEYAQQFKKANTSQNIFLITDLTEKTITYTTFFNGVMWDINIALPFSSVPTKDDFYSILLPMVFEEKE